MRDENIRIRAAAPEDAAAGLGAGDIYLYCPTLP